jgi:hypothetical protein
MKKVQWAFTPPAGLRFGDNSFWIPTDLVGAVRFSGDELHLRP